MQQKHIEKKRENTKKESGRKKERQEREREREREKGLAFTGKLEIRFVRERNKKVRVMEKDIKNEMIDRQIDRQIDRGGKSDNEVEYESKRR